MSDLAIWLELGLAVFVILSGQAVLWIKFKTMVEKDMIQCKDDLKRHDGCIANLKTQITEALTMEQHNKIQSDCQKNIYTDINNIIRSMDDLREEVRKNDDKLDNISMAIVELRADLKHMGAVS